MKEHVTNAVILFDSKFGTNRYKLKLGVFCTIDKEKIIKIVAISFQINEDEDPFTCMFTSFKKCFRATPKSFWSDEDAVIDATVISGYDKNLCVWCIHKIFTKTCHQY